MTPSRTARGRRVVAIAATVAGFFGVVSWARAYDLTDWLSIGGVAAGTGQCLQLVDSAGVADRCRGAALIRPEVSIRPTDRDELHFKFGFATGDGLDTVSPFQIAAWSADLNDAVTDINNRYDHLLNAWYKHEFRLDGDAAAPDGATVGVTVGIIDATDYLNNNAYAEDEYTQFLNDAFSNSPNSTVSSYDAGAAVEIDTGPWSARGVFMNLGENDNDKSTFFFGAQVGYTVATPLGDGTYRGFAAGASDDFRDPEDVDREYALRAGLSLDQQLGDIFGVWFRFVWVDDSRAVAYDTTFTGGLNVLGGPWGRPNDNIGLGLGYLDGGSLDVRGTHVAEVYYRFSVIEQFALTLDAQYMKDRLEANPDPSGFILGLRAGAQL